MCVWGSGLEGMEKRPIEGRPDWFRQRRKEQQQREERDRKRLERLKRKKDE